MTSRIQLFKDASLQIQAQPSLGMVHGLGETVGRGSCFCLHRHQSLASCRYEFFRSQKRIFVGILFQQSQPF